jgi:DNA-binding CsgD family transcriptional regulator
MKLKPISSSEFKTIMQRTQSEMQKIDLVDYFKEYIDQAKQFAVGPCFWLIANQETMKIDAASDNIGELTPFAKEKWINEDSFFWLNSMHPEDRGIVGGSIALVIKINQFLPAEKAQKTRLNVYCRMLDTDSKYRWVLLQFPRKYYAKDQKGHSTFIVTTDLSNFALDLKCMATIVDPSDNEFNFYATSIAKQEVVKLDIPGISKREHEILLLMTKGLNSPQIAEQLFISYHTVENHKRNLRQKTKTKTSAELIHFVWNNNLI